MPTVRFLALEETIGRKPQHFEAPGTRVSEYFGSHVFNQKAMRQYMTSEAFKAVNDSIENGTKISRDIADQVASGMKAWALSLGATHYTHWFQPLTGATAEKHAWETACQIYIKRKRYASDRNLQRSLPHLR